MLFGFNWPIARPAASQQWRSIAYMNRIPTWGVKVLREFTHLLAKPPIRRMQNGSALIARSGQIVDDLEKGFARHVLLREQVRTGRTAYSCERLVRKSAFAQCPRYFHSQHCRPPTLLSTRLTKAARRGIRQTMFLASSFPAPAIKVASARSAVGMRQMRRRPLKRETLMTIG